MNKRFEWINSRVTLAAALLTIISISLSLFGYYDFSSSKLSETDIVQLLKNHDSFVKSKNLEGQMSLFHKDFTISMVHSDGRKENLNRDQYQKMMSDLINMNLGHSIDDGVKNIHYIDSKLVIVTLLAKETISFDSILIPDYKVDLYQTIVITAEDEKAKILKVSSIAKKT